MSRSQLPHPSQPGRTRSLQRRPDLPGGGEQELVVLPALQGQPRGRGLTHPGESRVHRNPADVHPGPESGCRRQMPRVGEEPVGEVQGGRDPRTGPEVPEEGEGWRRGGVPSPELPRRLRPRRPRLHRARGAPEDPGDPEVVTDPSGRPEHRIGGVAHHDDVRHQRARRPGQVPSREGRARPLGGPAGPPAERRGDLETAIPVRERQAQEDGQRLRSHGAQIAQSHRHRPVSHLLQGQPPPPEMDVLHRQIGGDHHLPDDRGIVSRPHPEAGVPGDRAQEGPDPIELTPRAHGREPPRHRAASRSRRRPASGTSDVPGPSTRASGM